MFFSRCGIRLSLALLLLSGTGWAQTYFTGPYGPGGTWNLYELRARPDNPRLRDPDDRPLTWIEAHQSATSLVDPLSGKNIRGDLVSFSGPLAMAENTFIASKLTAFGGTDAWIGLTDSPAFGGGEAGGNPSVSGQTGLGGLPGDGIGWKWTSGEPFDFSNWMPNAPNDGEHANGVSTAKYRSRWNDQPDGLDDSAPPELPYFIEYQALASEDFAVPSTPIRRASGPAGGPGYFGVREVRSSTELAQTTDAIGLLLDPANATSLKDYRVPVLDYFDGGTLATYSHFGHEAPFRFVEDRVVDSQQLRNMAMVAHGRIRVPEGQGGEWTFHVNSDDGFELWIDGSPFTSTSGSGTTISSYGSMQFAFDRSPFDSFGVVDLSAGDHAVEFIYYQHGGQAGLELSAARGARTLFGPEFSLVGGPAFEVQGQTPRVAQSFTVNSVNRYSGPENPIDNLAEAEALLAHPGEGDWATTQDMPALDFGSRGLFGPPEGTPFAGDVVVHAVTTLVVDEPGFYSFGFESTGGARLTIQGAQFSSANGAGAIAGGGQSLEADERFGASRTWGTVELQTGEYPLEFLAFNSSLDGFFSLAELYVAPGEVTFFDRQAFRLLSPTSENVAFSRAAGLELVGYPGDANGDGAVDLTDFGILKSNFGSGTTAAQGDFNGDARADLTDFGILKDNFGASEMVVVPEPGSAALLLLAVPILIVGTRRQPETRRLIACRPARSE